MKGLENALLEDNRRPDNIDVNEMVSWAHYCKKQYNDAIPFLQTALKTNRKNPVLLCHAIMIYDTFEKREEAKTILDSELRTFPNFATLLKREGFDTLESLYITCAANLN